MYKVKTDVQKRVHSTCMCKYPCKIAPFPAMKEQSYLLQGRIGGGGGGGGGAQGAQAPPSNLFGRSPTFALSARPSA